MRLGNFAQGIAGRATNIGVATNSGNDTAYLFGPASGNNALYTDAAIALLYGNNDAGEASGFPVVNAIGAAGGANTKGHGLVNYRLNYMGSWVGGI